MKNSLHFHNGFHAKPLKNNTKNLNNAAQQLDLVDATLKIVLDYSYYWFHPLFSDGSEPKYYKEVNYKTDADVEFDKAYTNKIKKCFIMLIGIWYNIYTFFFGKKKMSDSQNKPRNSFKKHLVKNTKTGSYKNNKFTTNKAPT